MNKEDEKKFNSPSWWREAIQNRSSLESFVQTFEEVGVLPLRMSIAERGFELTPEQLQSQYELTKRTLQKLDS